MFQDDNGNLISTNAPYDIMDTEGWRSTKLIVRHDYASLDTTPVSYDKLPHWVQERIPADSKDVFFPIRGYRNHNMNDGVSVIGYLHLHATAPASTLGLEGWYRVGRIEIDQTVEF